MKFKNCMLGLRVQSKTNVNKIGTVVFVEPVGYGGYIGVRVQWDDDGATMWWSHGRIRKYVEPTKEPLKVGDKVKVLPFTVHKATNGINYWESMFKCIHEVGTIDCTSDTGFHVKTISGSWFYGAEYLERV